MRHPILTALALAALVAGCTPQSPPAPPVVLPPAPKPIIADKVVVLKGKRVLELVSRGEVFETFPIALSSRSIGTKRQQGDGRTPEGTYLIDGRSRHTKYTRELHISYPNAADRAQAAAKHVSPGGGIFIHGLPADYGPYDPPVWYKDWTEGCVSVGNAAIVKIWDAVLDGTPIVIEP